MAIFVEADGTLQKNGNAFQNFGNDFLKNGNDFLKNLVRDFSQLFPCVFSLIIAESAEKRRMTENICALCIILLVFCSFIRTFASNHRTND
ncbi:MAG: hypothetical protein J5552_10890 [Prevotella sp.]|nr:hypothetical protein [Prevotella sp.]